MLEKYIKYLQANLYILDIITVSLSWFLAYYIRFVVIDLPYVGRFPSFHAYSIAGSFIFFITLLFFSFSGLYQRRHVLFFCIKFFTIIRSVTILIMFSLSLSFFYRAFSFSRLCLIYFAILSIFFLIINRILLKHIYTSFITKNKSNLTRLLFIGNGDYISDFAKHLSHSIFFSPEVVGYVSKEKSITSTMSYLGNYELLSQIIEEHNVSQIYLVLDQSTYAEQNIIIEQLNKEVVDVHVIPSWLDSVLISPTFSYVNEVPVVTMRQNPLSSWNALSKRLFDIFFSLVVIILLLPVWLCLSLLIKLTSKGPIFYKQQRVGIDNKSFFMLKFRSMKTDAEAKDGAVWAKMGDTRTTKIGAILRKFSIDELPQFFNVLKGDMSVVGPRPERPIFIKEFREQIPRYMLRHKIRAGITGWAQINGWRGNTSLEKRIEFDLYYITNWSFGLDIKIILFSFWKGFYHKNAY